MSEKIIFECEGLQVFKVEKEGKLYLEIVGEVVLDVDKAIDLQNAINKVTGHI